MAIMFKVMDHKEMNGDQLIDYINESFKVLHGKPLFVFNGKPYQTIFRYDNVENRIPMAMCEWSTMNMNVHKIIKAIYFANEKVRKARSAGFRIEDVTGYDIVDAYDGKYYIGTFWSITLKADSKLYGNSYEIKW